MQSDKASSIDRIVKWNKDAGLLEKGYDDFLESSFQIEEALEGLSFNNGVALQSLCDLLNDKYSLTTVCEPTHKSVSRAIVEAAYESNVSDVDRLDKACDATVFAVGSMAKLGLTGEQIGAALNIVMDANDAKLGCKKDEHGKLTKPADFPDPEPRLQRLLNERL